MKRITYSEGKFSQIKLDDGTRIFVEILPESVMVKKISFLFIPTKIIWKFHFPFYIRTATEAWDSSKVILDTVLKTIGLVKKNEDLKVILESEVSKLLQQYVKERGEDWRDISVDKGGAHAIKQILNPKEIRKLESILHEYGRVMEEVGGKALRLYPAFVYPQSLLPYSKKIIANALNDYLQYIEDEKVEKYIQNSLVLLESFINDDEANKRNSELLNDEQFMEAIRKHAQE